MYGLPITKQWKKTKKKRENNKSEKENSLSHVNLMFVEVQSN